jgi:hypothetical protein
LVARPAAREHGRLPALLVPDDLEPPGVAASGWVPVAVAGIRLLAATGPDLGHGKLLLLTKLAKSQARGQRPVRSGLFR